MDLKKFELGAAVLKKVAGGVIGADTDPVGFVIEQVSKQYPLTDEQKAELTAKIKKSWPEAKAYLKGLGISTTLLDNISCELG